MTAEQKAAWFLAGESQDRALGDDKREGRNLKQREAEAVQKMRGDGGGRRVWLMRRWVEAGRWKDESDDGASGAGERESGWSAAEIGRVLW